MMSQVPRLGLTAYSDQGGGALSTWLADGCCRGEEMSGIFINYRGEDSDTAAALIDRELAARFGGGQVFLDCRSIPVGVDFTDELLGRLRACSVLLVIKDSAG